MFILEYLPSAEADILGIDKHLYEHSPAASDKFAQSLERMMEALTRYPFMYPVYEEDTYFRHMTMPYKYRLFYHVDEALKTIKIHRILHGARDMQIASLIAHPK